MAKTSKQVKNMYPETYGYEHYTDIPGNEDGQIRTYYLSFQDIDGDIRYAPVSKEAYESIRNYDRNLRRDDDIKTRCWIPSDHFGQVKCRHKCEECPFGYDHRMNNSISIDELKADFDYDIPDPTPSIEETLIQDERERELRRLISLMDEVDRKIVEFYEHNITDREAAEKLGFKSKTSIGKRREKIFASLREQLKDF